MPIESTVGKAVIDPKGHKAPRVGRSYGGVDMVDMGAQIKAATLSSVQKQSDDLERNKAVVLPAITTLQAKLQSLRADAVALSNSLGSMTGVSNTFKDLQSSVVKSGEFSTANYVDVTIDNTVAEATTNAIAIRVTQLAVVDSRITNSATILKADGSSPITSADDALGIAGSFTINGGSTITVSATDTLHSIVSSINNSNSNVHASYSQNGSNYYLTLNGSNIATVLTFVDDGNLLQNHFGINTTTPTDLSRLQAQIQCDVIDGANGVITKTYSFNNNVVANLIPGVTLKLLSTTKNSAGGYDNLNISISHNTEKTCDGIVTFFQHYNEIQEIINRNLMMDDEGNPLDPEASMIRSPLIKKLREQLAAISNFSVLGASASDYRTCADIGIVRDETATGFQTGTFTVPDAQKVLAAINNNFEKVKRLFGNYPTVSNTNFSVSDLGPTIDPIIAGRPISVTYSNIGGSYYARFTCGSHDTGNILQTSSTRLAGQKGSVFQNIAIDYQGAPISPGNSTTFTMTATQGLAATSATTLKQTLDSETGDFAVEVKRVKQANDKLKDKVKAVEKRAERDEKIWMAKAARVDATRAYYENFSKQLEGMFNNNNRH